MTLTQIIGIAGGLTLLTGYFLNSKKIKNPRKNTKNWFLFLGVILMASYSILNYTYHTGSILFVYLQFIMLTASTLMLTSTNEKQSSKATILTTLLVITFSTKYIENIETMLFIFGISSLGIGYVLKAGSARRNLFLTCGSILIAIFSYTVNDQIFLSLNILSILFNGYHFITLLRRDKKL